MAWFNFSYQGNDTYTRDTAVTQGGIGFEVDFLMLKEALEGPMHRLDRECSYCLGYWEGVANGDQLFLGRGGRVDPIEAE